MPVIHARPNNLLTNIVQLVKASVPTSIVVELLFEFFLDAIAQIGWVDIGIGLAEAQIQIDNILILISAGTLPRLGLGIKGMERIAGAGPESIPRSKRLHYLSSRKRGKGPNKSDALGSCVLASEGAFSSRSFFC